MRKDYQNWNMCPDLPPVVLMDNHELARAIHKGLAIDYSRQSMEQAKKNDIVRFGMSATVKVWTGDTAARVILPMAAVYQTGSKPHLWLVENGILRLQPVELGDFLSEGVVIRSGLKPGDVVVTAGVQKLQEGKKVKIWDGAKL